MMSLSMDVDLGPGHIGLYGDWGPSSVKKTDTAGPRTFRPMTIVARAGWIKMPLFTEVGLDPNHIVLDGDPRSSPQRGTAAPPLFGSLSSGTVDNLSNC